MSSTGKAILIVIGIVLVLGLLGTAVLALNTSSTQRTVQPLRPSVTATAGP